MALYLLKVSCNLAVLYGLYLLVFRRLTFFRWSRFYLMLSLLIAFLIPAITISVPKAVQPVWQSWQPLMLLEDNLHDPSDVIDLPVTGSAPLAAQSQWGWRQALVVVYLMGAGAMLLLFLRSLWVTLSLIRRGPRHRSGCLWVIEAGGPFANASFFRYVFLKELNMPGGRVEAILLHEGCHNRQLHSLDILLTECAKILLWFNPLIYFFKNSLRQVHEYEVDEYMSRHSGRKSYAELLLEFAAQRGHGLVNPFSMHPLKSRIFMLFKPKSRTMKKIFFLIAIPVCVLLTLGFAQIQGRISLFSHQGLNATPGKEPVSEQPKDAGATAKLIMPSSGSAGLAADTTTSQAAAPVKEAEVPPSFKMVNSCLPFSVSKVKYTNDFVLTLDAGHGGSDRGVLADDGTSEAEMNLLLVKAIEKEALAQGIKTILIRTDAEIVPLKDRVQKMADVRASLNLSIHMNGAVKGNLSEPQTGIQIFADNRIGHFPEAQKAATKLIDQLGSIPGGLAMLGLKQRQTGIWVVKAAPCPSLLLELGYLTNPKDQQYMMQESNRAELAKRIIEAVKEYKKIAVLPGC